MARVWRVHHAGAGRDAGELELDPDESHHVRRVLRLREGDELGVFDGAGREWRATIVASGAGGVRVRLSDELADRTDPDLAVVLVQSLARPERLDWVVQKGTELGVGAIRLVRAARSEPPAARLDRWRRIALEACKQSGRRRLPLVDELPELPSPPADALALALDTGTGAVPLGRALEDRGPAGQVWIAVGPEGGWEEGEIDRLAALGWTRVSLGPRVLRTETAGIVAAALVLHLWGDLGRG